MTVKEIHDLTLAKLVAIQSDWTAGECTFRAQKGRMKTRASFSLSLSGDKALTVERIGNQKSIGFAVADLYPEELRVIADAADQLAEATLEEITNEH